MCDGQGGNKISVTLIKVTPEMVDAAAEVISVLDGNDYGPRWGRIKQVAQEAIEAALAATPDIAPRAPD